ncbi:hypothetical protein DMUE_2751 [Dictyocoela muelleri]|nr:hypothetical protein DMUE_2751 [Dictyocoela muelleri]
MSSFDVTSSFTNIPLDGTINIICQSLFKSQDYNHTLTEAEFREFLNLVCKDSFFIFGDAAFQQWDAVQMDSSLGPTLANEILCHYETIWLDQCPDEFKPVFYRRYLDEPLAIYMDQSQTGCFLDYLNQQHVNIEFTVETDQNHSIPFFDINV